MTTLRVLGNRDEQLLFRTLGIEGHAPDNVTASCALLLGKDTPVPDDVAVYVRLPDTDAPLAETERLAALLGRAVGQGSVRF